MDTTILSGMAGGFGASDTVLCEAQRALTKITEQYFSPNVSLEQMRALVCDGAKVDPLRLLLKRAASN